MKRLRKPILTIWLIACLLPGRASAMDPSVMIDMMRVMAGMLSLWNVFSSVTGDNDFTNGWGNGFNRPFSQFSANSYNQYPPNNYNYPTNRPPPYQQQAYSPLNGNWLSREGIMFSVRGQQFEMQKRGTQALHGTLMLTRNRLIAYVEEKDITMPFRIEFKNNMFILQAPDGQMMLFKRVK